MAKKKENDPRLQMEPQRHPVNASLGEGGYDPAPTAGVTNPDDTDTGLPIGIGQATSTGTRPQDGGPNLEGPVDFDTDRDDELPYGHTSDFRNDPRDEKDIKSRHGERDRPDDLATVEGSTATKKVTNAKPAASKKSKPTTKKTKK